MTGSTAKIKNYMLGIVSLILIGASLLIYFDAYKFFSAGKNEVVTIGVFSDSYWEVQNGYSYRILDDAIQIFEKNHPGVKVEYVSGVLKEDYSEWLAEQVLSETAPDIFFILGEDLNDFAEAGVLKELKPLIESDGEFEQEAYYSSAYAYGQCKYKQYALPFECAPKLMFVNKTLLDKEGLAVPDDVWDWDEFYGICRKVTKDTDGDGVIDQFGVIGYTWEDAFESNGISVFNQDGTECNLMGKAARESLEFMMKLNRLEKEGSFAEWDFDLGNVAFQPMLFSEFRAYKPYPLSIKKYTGFEWECIPMPRGPKGDNISTLDTLLVAMNGKTKQEAYAWDLMKTLTYDKSIQSKIFDYSEGVSVLKEVTESDQTLLTLMENSGGANGMDLAVLSDIMENAVVGPRFRNLDEANTEVEKAVEEIMDGDGSISMEQIIWNRAINKYLKNGR